MPFKLLFLLLTFWTNVLSYRSPWYKELTSVNCSETIDVSFEYIASVHKDAFQLCKTMKKLIMDGNYITSFDADTLRGLSELEWLSVNRNRLESLPETVFAGLGSLKYLDLWNNKIQLLEPNTFQGVAKLERLNLGVNELNELLKGLFQGLVELRSLTVNANHIKALSIGIFSGLNRLQSIEMEGNNIVYLSAEVFDGLDEISSVSLWSNKIMNLDATALVKYMPSLKIFYLINFQMRCDRFRKVQNIFRDANVDVDIFIPEARKRREALEHGFVCLTNERFDQIFNKYLEEGVISEIEANAIVNLNEAV